MVSNTRFTWVVLLCGILIAGAVPAVAQEDQATEEAIEAAIEQAFEAEVVVTGSLIPRQDLEALSPVTVMDVEEITYSGTTRIEDLVTSLPQAFKGQNSTIANGASGTATVDLRHLGPVRTLVLINGRRMSPGDAFAAAPDLNFIPSSLVKRVDVLTGGASSVYGADAVAGVVNFVLDTDFEGVRGGLQYSFYQHDNSNAVAQRINEAVGFDVPEGNIDDGDGVAANIAVGGKFADGRGHASAYINYRDFESVTKSERDYFNCSVGLGATGPRCSGSSTTPMGRFLSYDANWNLVGDYALDWNGGGTGNGNTFRPRTSADVFNYGPYNHIQRPDRKYGAGGFANYRINEHAEVYVEVMFMDDYTDAQIAPTGNFGRTDQINCDNPMLSEQQRDLICTQAGFTEPDDIANVVVLRRNVEGGPRQNNIKHSSWRLLAGIRGDINETWSYDFYGLHAEVSSPQVYINDFYIPRIQEALLVVEDPDTGEWVCSSGNPDCVPWNIFLEGGVTDEAIDYMSLNAVVVTGTETQMLSGNLTGDLEDYGIAFPTASEGVQVAFGAEYRKEYVYIRPDLPRQEGNIAGFGGATVPIDGGFNVNEYFFEALIPVVQDAPGFQDLSIELGYRYSDYSLAGTHDTYKIQLSWAPTTSIKLRAGFNHAVRAPNAGELFAPQNYGLGGNNDICANQPSTGVPAATLEECIRTGVTPAQYGNILPNPAGQYNTFGGGNPLLDPEAADTITAGLVITPTGLPGFSATIDYYDIELEDQIGALDFDDILQTCANTGDPSLCSLIHRDTSGTLWLTTDAFIETNNQNIGELHGEGIDLNLNYLASLGDHGFLNMSLVGTYMLENRFTNPLTTYDCVGYFGLQCGQPDAEWRHRARFSWETNFNTVISLAWRYIGSTDNDDFSDEEGLRSEGDQELWIINDAHKLDAENYFDLSATISFAENYQFSLGVNNIFDEDPPLAPDLSDTGFIGTYDPLGRFIFASLRFNF